LRGIYPATVAFASLVALTSLAAGAQPPLPEPGEIDSHARYVEALREAERSVADELLARYERHIAKDPTDAIAAVERCRFLAAAFYDPETDENPREEEQQACVADVERRFADDPAVRVFAVEERWGDEAREAAEQFLAQPPASAQPQHLAAVHARLARLSESEEDGDAVSHAEQAMALDPSLDLRLLVARGLVDDGDPESAREVLLEDLLATRERWRLEQKAALLVDLGDFDAALTAFREVEQRGGDLSGRAEYAEALVGVGDIEGARTAWARLGEGWLSDESLRARFEFELAHGDGTTARAAYDALNARGSGQDPFGRDRLALLVAHPDAAWKLDDALRLLALAFGAFLISLVPALWILPVAWVGLARDRSSATHKATPGFGLHQAWAVTALYLLAEVLSATFQIESFTGPDAIGSASFDRAIFARYALVTTLAALAAVLLVVRGRVVKLLGRGGWSLRRTALISAIGVVGLRACGALLDQVVGSSGGEPVAAEMIRSLNDQYGLDTSILLMALITPLTEEIIFRGVLLSAFQRPLGPRWANLAQAALFGLIHMHPLVTPFAFAMGWLGGWMTCRSGSLRAALLMHVVNNALACAALALIAPFDR
jgi:membrane protease YdiL (CAAX protease family)/thioredoxin-like negative regulator of GroEL